MDYSIIIAGIIQGMTEWLPISSKSQGMLALMNFFNTSATEAFSIMLWLHIGTLLAVTIKFWGQLTRIIKSVPATISKSIKKEHLDETEKLTSFLIITTILSGIVMFPLYKIVKMEMLNLSPELFTLLLGIFLIITGLMLIKRHNENLRERANLEKKDSVIAGLLQGLSIIPGISRSGITTATLLGLKFKQTTALTLSFLMSIPFIFFGFIAGYLSGELTTTLSTAEIIGGNIISFGIGYATIDLLLFVANKLKFWMFCMFIGAIAILASLFYLL